MSAEQLLALQLTDSAIDRLRYQLPRLPEVVAAAATAREVVAWEERASELAGRVESVEQTVTASEHASDVLVTKRTRLETQLRTVISPREAEALMHEIATVNQQRSALDDEELAALDVLSETEGEIAEHGLAEERLRTAAAAAAENAAEATAVAEAELASLTATREEQRAAIDAPLLRRYDVMRGDLDGVAIAKLTGLRCDGCHIDMSRAEADDIKRMPADELPECPNCGRLLAR